MRFIDLFAGLGGFHVALRRLGHTCVFASELDARLGDLYAKNFGLTAHGDIRKVDVSDVPPHDILCAGFPCQPFSKAGNQEGLDCPRYGDLFDHVMRILRARNPSYLILENVPNLARHSAGETWKRMSNRLKRAGYEISEHRFSPHQFGIPQIRERIYIVGCRNGLSGFTWPDESPDPKMSIIDALEDHPSDTRPLSASVIQCLEVWQKFIDRFPKHRDLPTFPIWSMEFGATYPYAEKTPYAARLKNLGRYRGSHGVRLNEFPARNRMNHLPSHARTKKPTFPDWKIQFIRQNRELYKENRDWIDEWLPEILAFPPSLQKLEWNCKGGIRDIWKYVVQFRALGVRVKRPTSSPSLVAMTTTQVPIIAWQKRYMTPRECARLQCLSQLKHLPKSSTAAFKALGNAINADVVERIVTSLLTTTQERSRPQLSQAITSRRVFANVGKK